MPGTGLAVEVGADRVAASTNAAQLVAPKPTPVVPAPAPSTVVARWTLRVAAFLLPLAFLPNVVSEFVLPKLLLLRLLLAVLGILLLVRWFSQRSITWRRTPLDVPLIAFVGAAAVSTVFAINRNLAIFGSYDRWEGLLTIASYALLFWLTVQMLSGPSDTRGLTWSLLASGYFVGAGAILQTAGLLGGGYFRDAASGLIRPDVTLAHPDFVGIFLAMLLPIALAKVVSRRSAVTRVLAASIVVVIGLGLLATFTRAAWVGAIVGVIVVLGLRRGQIRVWAVSIVAAVLVGVLVLSLVVVGTASSANRGDFAHAFLGRVVSSADTTSGSVSSRLNTWRDMFPLIAGRPIFGWGPDTFGLVYPIYQSRYRSGEFFDKPHQDILGVAAAEGLVGLAAYLWMLIAFVRAFWRARYLAGAVALFGGWIAYMVSIQADFSWIPTAIPFWLLTACAIVSFTPKVEPVRVAAFPRRIARPALVVGTAVLIALLVPAVVLPYLADAKYYGTQAAPDLQTAQATIEQARQLAPYEAAYAIEAGNYALNLDQNGVPAPNADWLGARKDFETAARLGSFSPEMFQRLAVVDEHVGDHTAAVAAARRAWELDRFDPTSKKLLDLLTGVSP
jgi:O-antigen ligase